MSDGNHAYQKKFGTHIIRFEPPDLYLTTFVGEISGPEMTERNAEIARFAERQRWVLGIADIRQGSITPDARRAAALLTPRSRGTAFICLDPKQQLSLSLLGTARGAIQSGKDVDSPLGFFATEAEARAWIAERRKVLEDESKA
jgi:hypothetical protein